MSARVVDVRHPHEDRLTALLLWAGILLGPALWTAHLLIGYTLTTLGCSVTHVGAVALHILTIVLGLIVLLALLGAIAVRTRRVGEPNGLDEAARERVSFVAMVGALLSALFLVGIIFQDIPTFFLGVCR